MALEQLIQEQLARMVASESAIKELQRADRPAKNNFDTATIVDPTVSNDITEGYSPGSVWINTATGDVFVNINNTTGAAVWVLSAASSGIIVFEHTDSEEGEDTTTSTTFQTAFTTSFTPPAANYLIIGTFEARMDDKGKVTDVQILLDTVEIVITNHEVTNLDDAWVVYTFTKPETLTAALHTIDFEFRVNPGTTGSTARIRRKRIFVTRTS